MKIGACKDYISSQEVIQEKRMDLLLTSAFDIKAIMSMRDSRLCFVRQGVVLGELQDKIKPFKHHVSKKSNKCYQIKVQIQVLVLNHSFDLLITINLQTILKLLILLSFIGFNL